jgi:hypothetical protein
VLLFAQPIEQGRAVPEGFADGLEENAVHLWSTGNLLPVELSQIVGQRSLIIGSAGRFAS